MMFLYISIVLLLEMPAAVLGMTVNQDPKVLVKAEGKTVYLPCKETGMSSSDYIHWYQMKEGKAPSRLLYINQGGTVTLDTNNDQAKDFTVEKTKLYDLKLRNTQKSHAAIYFCAYWIYTSGDRKVFGSGTRLYVTDPKSDTVKTPKLTGYLPSKKSPDNHGKQTMLCHASDMFPDLVTFKWQEKSVGGKWTDASEENVVEQRKESKPVTVTSMMIVDKNMAENKDFKCIVTHEGSTGDPQILEMKEENSKPAKESEGDDQNTVACTPSAEEPLTKQISGDSEQIPSMFLFVYAYGVLLMKNGLFFCVVSIFLLKSKAGKKDESS